jgi:hypothetical protein
MRKKKYNYLYGIYSTMRISPDSICINPPNENTLLLVLLKLFLHKICTSANFIVPLHREPALGMSVHQRRRVADIIRRRLLAVPKSSSTYYGRKNHQWY